MDLADPESALLSLGKDATVCTVCGKGFSAYFHVKRHIETVHLNVKPYECKYCKKKFGQQPHWKKHESLHALRNESELNDDEEEQPVEQEDQSMNAHEVSKKSVSFG